MLPLLQFDLGGGGGQALGLGRHGDNPGLSALCFHDGQGQAVEGSAVLAGALKVSLVNGFQLLASDQLPILSCAGRSGAFGVLDMPSGCSINYSNAGVFLVGTGVTPLAPRLFSPQVSGPSLLFRLQTINGQSYTVLRNDDLKSANWIPCTNFVGDGSLMQVIAPSADLPRAWFRVRQP